MELCFNRAKSIRESCLVTFNMTLKCNEIQNSSFSCVCYVCVTFNIANNGMEVDYYFSPIIIAIHVIHTCVVISHEVSQTVFFLEIEKILE